MADWTRQAACLTEPHDWWFSFDHRDQARAKAVCAACPVQDTCYEYAHRTRQAYGIWGGVDMTASPSVRTGDLWDLTCTRCLNDFTAPAGWHAKPSLCDACRPAARQDSARERNRRYRGNAGSQPVGL